MKLYFPLTEPRYLFLSYEDLLYFNVRPLIKHNECYCLARREAAKWCVELECEIKAEHLFQYPHLIRQILALIAGIKDRYPATYLAMKEELK